MRLQQAFYSGIFVVGLLSTVIAHANGALKFSREQMTTQTAYFSKVASRYECESGHIDIPIADMPMVIEPWILQFEFQDGLEPLLSAKSPTKGFAMGRGHHGGQIVGESATKCAYTYLTSPLTLAYSCPEVCDEETPPLTSGQSIRQMSASYTWFKIIDMDADGNIPKANILVNARLMEVDGRRWDFHSSYLRLQNCKAIRD